MLVFRRNKGTAAIGHAVAAACFTTALSPSAHATPPTPGYPEPVIQWGVQKGESCEAIAVSLYGSAKLTPLLQRYNRIACKSGAPLREGLTLVVPATATELPDARLRSMNPDVRARAGGGAWAPAASGMPLFSNYNVNTLDKGRADVEFVDRTRVFLAPNTLVVIYGTAAQTHVNKSAPPAVVEVQEGEVKAGLAALRGDAVDIAIKGGGRVSAASRDTVVQRKGDRTTVAVFDGKAGVTSGGKSVAVPEKFGTRFVGTTPPAPPRPLPPAPVWSPGVASNVLAPRGAKGVLDVAWLAAKDALAYRVELLREGGSDPIIVSREEVPPSITSFHGELPPGTYRLAVRTIDKEEYLGLAAELQLIVIEAEVTGAGARVTPRAVEANPYGELDLTPDNELEMSLDGGPFGPVVAKLDLSRVRPKEIRLRKKGSTQVALLAVSYAAVTASFPAPPSYSKGAVHVRTTLSNATGVDSKRIAPAARLRMGDQVHTAPLTQVAIVGADTTYEAAIPVPSIPTGGVVEVVDGRGVVLGVANLEAEPERLAPPIVRFGAWAPLWQASPVTDVIASAPTAIDGAAVGLVVAKGPKSWGAQAEARASGSIGPVGLDGAIRSASTDGSAAPAAAWLGARARVFRMLDGGEGTPRSIDGAIVPRFEIAPLVRLGLPVTPTGAPAQIEPMLTLGGGSDRLTWLVDLGGRARFAADSNATGVPKGQGFLIASGAFDPLEWMRLHALLDTHLAAPDAGKMFFRGGLELGLEAGTRIFGGLALRLTPLPDAGAGVFMGGLNLGYRAP